MISLISLFMFGSGSKYGLKINHLAGVPKCAPAFYLKLPYGFFQWHAWLE